MSAPTPTDAPGCPPRTRARRSPSGRRRVVVTGSIDPVLHDDVKALCKAHGDLSRIMETALRDYVVDEGVVDHARDLIDNHGADLVEYFADREDVPGANTLDALRTALAQRGQS